MKKFMFALMVAVISLASGCATITRGTQQNISVTSNPSGAKVFVDDIAVGTTPATVKVTNDKDHLLRFELSGYAPYEVPLTRRFSGGWAVLDVLLFWPGIFVDAMTGAIYTVEPSTVNADFNASSYMPDINTLHISLTMKPEKNWVKIGQMQKIPR